MRDSSHGADHGVLPSRVRLASVSVVVAFGAGVALPRVSSPPDGFVIRPPSSAACGGRRGDVVPLRSTVLLPPAGRRRVGTWVVGRPVVLCARHGERHAARVAGNIGVMVVAGVGGRLSLRRSGVGGVIIRIPPERETVCL